MQQSLSRFFRRAGRLVARGKVSSPDVPAPPPTPMASTFTHIYRTNAWQNAESRSGPGSTVNRCQSLGPVLLDLIAALDVKSLLDAPCGDFNWMKEVPLAGIDYIGVDVVPELIAANQARYGRPGRAFHCLDITAGSLPRADLILCRDALVHLSLADVRKALAAFQRSGSSFLAATTFPSCTVNAEIATGGWRTLNLQQPPFCLPTPLRLLSDGCPIPEYADKALGVWDLRELST